MATVTLDLSKAVPLPQAPVQLDMSKAQPLPQPEDTRSLYQRAKDNFNANTQGAKPGDGAVKGLIENIGAGGGDTIRSVAHFLEHPIDTTMAAGQAAASRPVGEQVVRAVAGPASNLYDLAKSAVAQPGRTIGQIGSGAILGEAAAPALSVVSSAPELLAASKAKLYPTSQSLAMDVSAARNLSKALIVDPAGVNNFVKAATDEAGTIVGYAKDKGIPINSKVDFANAAKQTADAVQQHFDSILEPNKDLQVAVPGSYEGVRIGEGQRATLEQVNKRIDAISSELKSNVRKPLSSQVSSANASDADLISEKQALANVLHKYLSQATGLSPEEIAGLRQQAGKLRTIADESQLSANRDLTAAGKQEMGTTTSAVGTKAGLIDRALQTVQGGPEIIGNRQVKNALQKVSPRSLNLPQPNP